MSERGVIQNRDRKRQIVDFSNLKYGKITPTDIDGVLDFGNRLFVYFELKHGNAEVPYGQRLALERLVDSNANSGIPACCLIARHYVNNTEEDVNAAITEVVEYRWEAEWHKPKEPILLFQAIDKLRELVFNPL